jgi:hypothetical protein
MAVKFSNNFSTALVSSISSSDTVIELLSVSGLPTLGAGDYTYLTFDTDTNSPTIEIVKVTAINAGTNEVTVTRAQDGTTASSFAAGTKVELRLSAILLNDVSDEASVTDWGDILNKPSLLLTDGDGSDLTDVRAETVEVTVKNVSGGSLAKGTPVHQTGTSGAATFEVVAADASNASVMPAHFVLLETLADQAEGRGLLMGRISGVDTSSFSEGDTIYVAVGGGYTNVAPTGEGNLIQNLGTVTRVDSTNGGGEVMGAGRANATPNLNNGNIFLGNASNQAVTASLSTSVSNLSHYNNANWDTAYGWGDHASAGYLTSFTETDPVFSASAAAGISATNITNWDTAYGWGDHASAGYQLAATALTTSTTFGGDVSGTYNAIVVADDSHNHVISNVDGLQAELDSKLASATWTGSAASGITATQVTNWDTAYGWGNHASQGYATTTYVDTAVSNLVDAAPATLDTLNELAAALGDDPNFATTVSNQIGLKQDASTALTTSTTFGGDVSGTYNAIVIADDSHNHVISNVDGLQAALDSKLAVSSYTAADVLAKLITVDGATSGLDADTLDGQHGSYYYSAGNPPPYPSDADTVDGLHAASFLRSDAADEASPAAIYIFNKPSPSGYQTAMRVGNYAGGLYLTSDNAIIGKGAYYNNGWIATAASGSAIDFQTSSPKIFSHTGATPGNAVSMSASTDIWHAGNDGSGSGLDADLLDGQHGSYYASASSLASYLPLSGGTMSGTLRFNQGAGFGRVSYVDNYHGLILRGHPNNAAADVTTTDVTSLVEYGGDFRFYKTNGTVNELLFQVNPTAPYYKGNTIWHSGNDGSGSGLDADTVDGYHYNELMHATSTKVWSGIAASGAQAKRFHIMRLYGTPAHWAGDWQNIRIKIVEESFESSYAEYHLWGDYIGGGDPNGAVNLQLKDIGGNDHNRYKAVVTGATATGWNYSGQPTYYYDVYIDVAYYKSLRVYAIMSGHSYTTATPASGTGHATLVYTSPSSSDISDFTDTKTTPYFGNYKIWNEANDGSGSGLDADTVDGIDSSQFLRSDAGDTATGSITFNGATQYFRKSQTAGDYTTAALFTESYDSTSTGIAFHISGIVGKYLEMNTSGTLLWNTSPIWHSANDGSGSGLDADTVDGIQSANIIYGSNPSGTNQYTFTNWNSIDKSGFYSDDAASNRWASAANWSSLIHLKLYSDNNNYASQLGFNTYDNRMYARTNNGGTWTGWDEIWHSGSDGSGSGLDADLLDGYQHTSFWKDGEDRRIGVLRFSGEGGNSGNGVVSYGLYQEGGAWSNPFPDLVIGFHTGIKIGGYYGYNGTRFYNDAPGRAGAAQVMSIADGDSNVRIANTLYIGSGTAWHSANDGSGSGLDADTLDGLQPSQLTVNRASGLSDGGDIGSHPGSHQLLYTGQISSSVAGLFAASDNSNSIITVNRHPGNYNSQLGFSSNGRIYYRKFSNTTDYTTRGWDTVWTSSTDGSGSGLDADTLDGNQSSFFADKTNQQTFNAPLNINGGAAQGTNDGTLYVTATNNNDWGLIVNKYNSSAYEYGIDLRVGSSATYGFRLLGNGGEKFRINGTGQAFYQGSSYWHALNDGSGSGLDADLLDGKDHTKFGATLATYGTTAGASGRIRCTAPFNTNSAHMFQVTVSVYSSYTVHTYVVGGYMYPTTNQWHSPTCVYSGTGTPDIVVGRDANGRAYISIANGSYTGVRVHNMTLGYQTSLSDTYDPWTITIDGATENSVPVSLYKTWNSGNDGSGSGLDADLLDGQQPSALSVNYANTAGSAPANGGTATALNGSNFITRSGSSGNYNTDFNNTPAGGVRHQGDDANITNSPGGTWWFTDNYRHSNSTNYWGTQIAWGWEDNANKLAQRNVTGGNWSSWVYYWNTGNDGSGSGLDADTCDGQHLGTTSNPTFNTVRTPGANAEVKFSVWSGTTYGIGMQSGVTYGGLNDYAMTFCMNNDSDRGFWWGYSGQAKSAGAMSLTTGGILTVASSITAGGNITAYSDRRLKEDLRPITDALSKVQKLSGNTYTRNDQKDTETRYAGLIAQECAAVLPESVKEADGGVLALDYNAITALLLESIRELKAEVDDLKAQLKEK